jgi:hypothetical protein
MSNFMDKKTKIEIEERKLAVWHLLKKKPSTMAPTSDCNQAHEGLYRAALTIPKCLINRY